MNTIQPDFYIPDCPVSGHSISRITRYQGEEKTVAKRTCPVCRRRFLFKITWHPDRACEVQAERITEYRKPKL